MRCPAGLILLVVVLLAPVAAKERGAARPREAGPSPAAFRRVMPVTVRVGHPAVAGVADGIRRLSDDPVEQLSFVAQATRLLVEYDSDRRVYGRRDWHATLDQMVARAEASGWTYLRDDCDGRAVFAAHVLEELGFRWRLKASGLKRHAWVSVVVAGRAYDLLDLRPDDPELQTLAYRAVGRWLVRRSQPPPFTDLRARWRRRGADVALGRTLGLITVAPGGGEAQPRFAVNWVRRASGPTPTERKGIAATADERRLRPAPDSGLPTAGRSARRDAR